MSTATTINPSDANAALDSRAAVSPHAYWNTRAAQHGWHGEGLAAVCSLGMPVFYNRYIQFLQQRALAPWLAVPKDASVLEIGCGVGRWTRRLAVAGHDVVGFDLSRTMIDQARRRAARDGVSDRCRFFVADCASFSLDRRFDRIFGVTVLQHILNGPRLAAALINIARHLAPGGRVIVLEAAPSTAMARSDNAFFVARTEQVYRDAFEMVGLTCLSVEGVDPAPFRTWCLPWFQSLPRSMAASAMFMATIAGSPIDVLTPSRFRSLASHKVFVLAHTTRASLAS